jgi:mRNA-degrading endonuclease RelE of RelBE toxin-antitoxin system
MTDQINVLVLKGFRRAVKKLFSEEDIETLVAFLQSRPDAGDVIPGTGGLRKLRWALEGRGKRGGSRVIYYYHRPELEVLLLTAYAKNEQEDLSASDKKLLAALVKDIIG